ncbi:hypothetical protein VT84_37125 [Gemmata sp. SH-PL17]|uniref:hypothetical protein n=1 Tax=Gemmata sp. SH-PL17 TaxID=1630693 RepID=UPI00078B1786|nr:hypothetical protein [Gemmata sp. SH-PL17]AMV30076.1 hypothetical protein VT84_37125 [Gemmata sp. SH-PL17]
MSQQQVVPSFGDWTINEVKDSVLQAIVNSLKRSGFRGIAVLSVTLGLVWVATKVVASDMDGSNKAISLLGITCALLVLGLAALFTERNDYATAKQEGRDGSDQSGAVLGNQGTTGETSGSNGLALDG